MRLFGRDQAKASVLDVVGRQSGEARLTSGLVIDGAAGIGKSELVRAAFADPAVGGVTPLYGWCLPLTQGLPLLPLLDVVRSAAEVDEGALFAAALDRAPAFVRSEIDQFLGGGQPLASGEADGGWARERRFAAILALLGGLFSVGSVAVVVEDVHWADPTTRDLLEYLLAPRRAGTPPFVLTHRTDGEPDWLGRLVRAPWVKRIELMPLDRASTGEQITALTGTEPNERTLERIFARAEGNPFFTEQLLAHKRDRGDGDRSLPRDLQVAMSIRLNALRPRGQKLLAVLGVAARPLDQAALSRVAGIDDASVNFALQTLVRRGFVVAADSCYRPQHMLLGEAAAADLLVAERAELHGRVGELLADAMDDHLAGEAAEHFARAGRREDELIHRVAAARRADTSGAAVEALGHWLRAVDIARGLDDRCLPEGLSTVRLYGAAQNAAREAGDESAAAGLAADGLRTLLPTATLAEQADLHALGRALDGDRETDRTLAHLAHAIKLYRDLPPSRAEVQALTSMEGQLRTRGRYAEAEQHAQRAHELASKLGLRAERLQLAAQLGWHLAASGDPDHALRSLADTTAELLPSDPLRLKTTVKLFYVDLLRAQGRLRELGEVARPTLNELVESGLGHAAYTSLLRWTLAWSLLEQGHTGQAAATLDTTERPYEPDPSERGLRAYLDLCTHGTATAGQSQRRPDSRPPRPLAWRVDDGEIAMELELWTGETRAAVERGLSLFHEASLTDEATACGPMLVQAMRGCADLLVDARASRDTDKVELAKSLADQVVEAQASMTEDPFSAVSRFRIAPALNLSWQAEAQRASHVDAVEIWRAAVDGWRQLDRPHRAAYAGWRCAESLLSQRHRHDAAQMLQTAAAEADGHQPLLQQLHATAHLGGVDLSLTTAEPKRPPRQPSDLTEREIDVLRLLCDGQTNPQIARTLYISPRTAGVHVANILRKLGVASRTQAAIVAHRTGLLDAVQSSS